MADKEQKTLFSGIQPTGNIHIGNYLGALKNWVDLQEQYRCIYSIVDLHAITIDQDPKKYQEQIMETAIDILAIGVDPKKATLFVQSKVTQHTELAWMFNTLTPMSELERMTQYKDKSQDHKENINVGLFDYPVLQAADVLLYHAEVVPVGEDQLQHLELSNMIGRKFNNKYGNFFKQIKPVITAGARIMSLTEPDKKMSKSKGEKNYIAIRDSAENIRKKVAHAVTDTGPAVEGKKSLGVNNLFELLSLFSDEKTVAKFETQYNQKTIKYSELKKALAEAIIMTLTPIQKRIKEIETNPKKVKAILDKGAKQAQVIAEKNMADIKKKMGL
ncbi:MAG: tryptophan--tRNA ligase [Parcubacteria group bacterium CG1_02_37_51]|uniref:Tryptophan--tRNA ligase n=2 Tax=Candidatus Komeiliibacteriota TaxID=1817908 RepID=A0A2M8DRC8_9BACT|nr:MAG: tryptophan--tRNA ligase [Parcubacteria group bacterium CG1_02_37_51]PIY95225.1 MAG: tryptophan--tRNA ligase [Candidatus Komeilibacteria bacterium CG_4_10_14_0_8_um_filter_37_78]PJC01943.1 MAG: tryptophan--tRNA ligase [Candidatus Komeilibacteria bacterium CG_4_9_14_0_8_um_filter_36_9]